MASVMHLLRHRVRLVEELLGSSVVDAQDVPADVEDFLAMTEVRRLLPTNWSCVASRLHFNGDYYFVRGTDVEPSYPRP